MLRNSTLTLGVKSLTAVFVLTAASIGSSYSHAQVVTLDDRSLSTVTADSLGTDSHQTDSASPLDSAADSIEDHALSGVIVAGSTVKKDSEQEVTITDESQSSVRALNLVNSAAADVANGLNVFVRNADSLNTEQSTLNIEQANQVTQTHIENGALGRFHELAPSFTRVTTDSGRLSNYTTVFSQMETLDRQILSTSETTVFNATADAPSPDILDGVTLLDHTIALPSFQLGPNPFDVVLVDPPGDWLDDVSITITPPTLTVQGASISTGGVSFENGIIVFTAPTLNLPSLSFRACFRSSGCTSDQYKTVTIAARSISLGPGRTVDNPISAQGIGFGFAIAGSGSIDVEGGVFHIGGEIPIDLNALFNFELNVRIPVVNVTIPISIPSVNLPEFSIPIDIDIPLDVPDEFNVDMENQACVFSNGQLTCSALDVSTTEFASNEEGYSESTNSEQIQSEQHSNTQTLHYDGAVSVSDATAKLIVLDESTAESNSYNVVIVADGAQTDIRALNLVNAVVGIIGNSANVSSVTSGSSSLSGISTNNLKQVNLIIQIGGQ